MHTLESVLAKHPFFEGLEPQYLALLAGCASNMRFEEGQYLFREGQEATQFYILRYGRIAIEAHTPTRDIMLYTHDEGDVVGWSWLFPPYHWHFSGRAVQLTRVISLDAVCLRGKCEADRVLGYEFLKRFSYKVVRSLDETRMQLLDLYGVQPPVR
ncbi:MAG: cyclic nucleotide-binding domain-containing protein [Anaerolineae bacterium]|nr:cyclic nucleotide-binding domain-containing protein [Anaerolineae bacterium]